MYWIGNTISLEEITSTRETNIVKQAVRLEGRKQQTSITAQRVAQTANENSKKEPLTHVLYLDTSQVWRRLARLVQTLGIAV
jgi:hypothetical protein